VLASNASCRKYGVGAAADDLTACNAGAALLALPSGMTAAPGEHKIDPVATV
jgi:hypothetical protein